MNNEFINNNDHIEQCIKNLKPLESKQKIDIKKLPIESDYLPKYILDNLSKYKSLIDNGEM